MITADQRRAAADALRGAREQRLPIEPLSDLHPDLDLDDAYAIQDLLSAERIAAGRRVVGYKVGLTSRAMQRQLGVDQPDAGVLHDDMVLDSGAIVDASRLISPKVEPEFAVVLGSGLRGPGITVEDVRGAVSLVIGSIEVIDSRIRDWRIRIADTVADNASSAAVVVGTDARDVTAIDLQTAVATLTINGVEVGRGTGTDVLGDPLAAVAWLANALGDRGIALPPGALILPGSVCAAAVVVPGDEVVADFGPLGTVSMTVPMAVSGGMR